MTTRWWKVTSSLLRLSTRVTTLRTSVANSYPKASLRHLNTSNLKLSEEKETFHFMPLSYNEDVRAVSGIYAPDEPPQAPLPLDHELNGECDFSRQLDMHEDVSDREAAIGVALVVAIFGGGYYLAEYVFPKEYKVTRTELPYLEQDLGGYLKLDETGTRLIPQFDFVSYAAPDTPQCGYLSTIKKKSEKPVSAQQDNHSRDNNSSPNNNNNSHPKDDIQNGENSVQDITSNQTMNNNNNGHNSNMESNQEPDYDKYIQGSS
ncbi:hypothetical protein GAYE_SCF25G4483 [Galdieria yellowstonensis]|uniref:Uncharacterized protein n=1 Tax=Galdieria yellowstonensis TaxID=3028027 RepID=A0AAV9IGM7_9RHOD|nr:hypothetical protein GAYE_SCF25G4483 [Galdieria yellowstonensis]